VIDSQAAKAQNIMNIFDDDASKKFDVLKIKLDTNTDFLVAYVRAKLHKKKMDDLLYCLEEK
jgi:hypothetical protein